jgi:hypothetical protein
MAEKEKSEMKRVSKLMTCECGFPGADRSHRYHRRSVYHRQHRRIRGLLSNDSLSFADIGDRLGITRERVRQIARQLGMTSGRQRREQHALHQRIPAWHERRGYRELIAKGKEFGYTVTPSRVDSPEGWRFQARIVVINGWLQRLYTTHRQHFADIQLRLALAGKSVTCAFINGNRDHLMYENTYNGTQWTGYVKVGGPPITAGPSCASYASGKAMCVVVGLNNQALSVTGP